MQLVILALQIKFTCEVPKSRPDLRPTFCRVTIFWRGSSKCRYDKNYLVSVLYIYAVFYVVFYETSVG